MGNADVVGGKLLQSGACKGEAGAVESWESSGFFSHLDWGREKLGENG